jgi:dipeptidase E
LGADDKNETMKNKTQRKRHIVAMGGGGFSEEPDNPLLDDFALGLSGAEIPRVCFLPTASGDPPGYIEKFHAAFPSERAIASHLTLFRDPKVGDLRTFLLGQDVIYVGGGSTANMLAVWRVHGIDLILREAWESGVILAGLSAGMICWFAESLTDSYHGELQPLKDGLALLGGSACPHYDSGSDRRAAYHRCVATGQLSPGIAAEDGVALHFVGTELAEAVSSRPEARAYMVKCQNGQAVETELRTRYLGARKT